MYEVVFQCFETIVETSKNWDSETLIKAKGFISCLANFEVLVSFVVTKNCLRYLKQITVSLQQRSRDILSAYTEIQTVKSYLQDMRNEPEGYFEVMMEEAKYLAEGIGSEPSVPSQCKRQTLRNNTPATSVTEYYKRSVLIPFLDHLLNELNSRFSKHSQLVSQSLLLTPQVLVLSKTPDLPPGLQELSQMYKDDMPCIGSLTSEYHRWYKKWTSEDSPTDHKLPSTGIETLHACNGGFYPNIFALLKISCTPPVTTTEYERSFSSLKLLKTYLRSTMTSDRLNSLALMHIHRSTEIDKSAVIDQYATAYNSRMKLSTTDFLG
ncbi:unnamed protein product [Mytilus coruscus]|uniref:HAT C-terminal dimerisation domain-containing protein n=1 Tax=Mytilus coruscus TaxID=42192 RepID=A0A6J8C5P2_MYTCO|nr:unnamed protein product [Mytilus coruscus]